MLFDLSLFVTLSVSNFTSDGGGGGEGLLGILGGGVLPGSPNPDPISDQKMSFSAPILRPGL